MEVKVPVGKIAALLAKTLRFAISGGRVTPAERDELVADLATLLAELAPEFVELNIGR